MLKPKPKVAIIGTGMIGAVHLAAARSAGAEVVGVLGSTPKRSTEFSERWSVRTGYRSLDNLLEDDLDAVHICTPNDSHSAIAHRVIDSGRHVLCEKPLALTVAQAEALVQAAERRGVIATVPFVYRYHPMIQEIRARRKAGHFGPIHLIHGSYLQDWLLGESAYNWRVNSSIGGASRAFADIGSHWCDLVEFVSGELLSTVSASTSVVHLTRPVHSGPSFENVHVATSDHHRVATEDIAMATFKTETGVPVSAVISQVSAGRKNRLWFELDGGFGSVAFNQENPNTVWAGTDEGAEIWSRNSGNVAPQQRRLNQVPAGHPQGYAEAFAAYVGDTYASINGKAVDGLPTFRDGLRAVRITQAVVDSAKTGLWTSIPTPINTTRIPVT